MAPGNRAARFRRRRPPLAVVVDLAYSVPNENEADKIGVVYAALAGYNPYAISSLWGDIARKHRNDRSWFRTRRLGPGAHDPRNGRAAVLFFRREESLRTRSLQPFSVQ